MIARPACPGALGGVAEPQERPLLDLADAFGADPERAGKLTERLLPAGQPEPAAQDRPLPFAQTVEQLQHLPLLEPPGHALERLLGAGIGEQLAERADVAVLTGDLLVERPGAPLRADEPLDLPAREARLPGQFLQGRLPAPGLQVLTASGPDARELAGGAVGQHDGPAELGDELLHRLADPPGRIRPDRRAEVRVVAPDRAQQPDDALLDELGALDGGRTAVEAGDTADQRHVGLDQLVARVLVAGLRGQDQRALVRG